MDNGLCGAIGTPGSMRRENLLAMVVECVGVNSLWRAHRGHSGMWTPRREERGSTREWSEGSKLLLRQDQGWIIFTTAQNT